MSEKQSILNQWGVPHMVHQDVVCLAEAAWLEVIDQHIAGFSPIDKRIFLEYAMFGVSVACSSRMIITGILAKQAAREHVDGIVVQLNKAREESARVKHIVKQLDDEYGSPAGLKQAIEDDYGPGGDDGP